MSNLVEKLKNSNCIKVGEFKLRNGEISKYYFDMKNLISYPNLLKEIGDSIWEKYIKKLPRENLIICGVPLGGLPLACYISTTYNIPMIMVRKSLKNYGTQKLIEGEYNSHNDCIIIEDVITTGSSLEETYSLLKDKLKNIYLAVILKRGAVDNIRGLKVDHLLDSRELI